MAHAQNMNRRQQPMQYANQEFKHGLCDCCLEPSRCCYIWCCFSCATADLGLLINPCCIQSKQARWWTIALLPWIVALITGLLNNATGAGFYPVPFGHIVAAWYVVFEAAKMIAYRIGYFPEEFGCGCCCQYWWCFMCKTAQVANQLDVDQTGVQSHETCELVTEINLDTPIKGVLCKITNPPVGYGAQAQYPPQQHVNVEQNSNVEV